MDSVDVKKNLTEDCQYTDSHHLSICRTRALLEEHTFGLRCILILISLLSVASFLSKKKWGNVYLKASLSPFRSRLVRGSVNIDFIMALPTVKGYGSMMLLVDRILSMALP